MTEPRQDLPTDPPLSRLYRQLATAEPPAAVDQHLLAVAHAAIAPEARPSASRSWWPRWRTPLTLATTLLITLSLTVLHERQPADAPPPDSPRPASDQIQAPPQARQEPEPSQPATAAPARKPSMERPKAPSATVKQEAAEAPIAPHIANPFPTQPVETKRQSMTTPSATVYDSATSGPAAASAASPVAVLPSAPVAASSPAPVAVPAPLTAPAAAPAPRAVGGSGDRLRTTPSVAESAMPALAKSRGESLGATRPAESWLEEIRALRRDGKTDEAAKQLREFRRAYPDFPLPEDLRP
ncbi:MAG TPA: hypothetical protein PLS67_06910 [Accumulibacter sp.]|jgi:hypothetical protein|nr:hypothetical protein [Accumulibacter sp.]HQC80240.1 hypothetical protein [Accumulibacter sp.]